MNDSSFPAFMRNVTGSTAADSGDVPARPPATPAKATPAPLKDDGPPSPPLPPTRSGGRGSGGGSSSKKLSPMTVRILALVFVFVGVVGQLIYFNNSAERDQRYNNTDAGKVDLAGRNKVMELRAQTELVRAQTELAQATGVVPVQVTPQAAPVQESSPSRGSLDVHDGDQFIIPENTKTVIHGPATIVIVNTAWRIKSFSGDLTVERLGSGEPASAPSANYFERVPKWPAQSKVRIHVNQGTAELGT